MADIGVLRPPARILFGEGCVAALGDVVAPHGRRVLVCTDGFLARTAHCETVVAALRAAGLDVTVLDATQPELPSDTVAAAADAAAAAAPDCIVGFGGGSCIDMAKLLALALTVEEPLDRFYGESEVPSSTVPVIAVPTTAGTGSEATPVAVLTDAGRGTKVGISSPYLVPRAAVCDPLLTHGVPPALTAHAGIDALAHAVEAYTAIARDDWRDIAPRVFVGRNVLSAGFALEAIRLVSRALPAAVHDDRRAREAMLRGSLCAGLAFGSAGTALAHALQYPIGAMSKTPHGLGIGLLLPYVMQFNVSACPELFVDVAHAMGVEDAPAAVLRLGREIGLPTSLRDIGIDEASLPAIAAEALGIARLVDNNPRPATRDDLERILRAACRGELPSAV